MMVFFLSAVVFILLIFILVCGHRNKKRIHHLIRLVERLNEGDYSIDWNSMREGDYGILQNELYKMTVKLREAAELERSDKERIKETLADISHQIKTPLTTIRLGLEEMAEGNLSEGQSRTTIRRMKRSTDHITELVSIVLKLSKLEANAVTFQNTSCTGGDLVRLAKECTEALADLKGIELVINENGDSKILVDPGWQTEAIANIIKNCIEHSNYGTCVEVDILKNPMYVRIRIRDHGGGIPEYELPHIFDRFYSGSASAREHNRTTGQNEQLGIGIGLALAKKVIIGQNGLIFARNHEDGMEFEIRYKICANRQQRDKLRRNEVKNEF